MRWPRPRRWRAHTHARRARRSRNEAMYDRRRHLHLLERQDHRSKSCKPRHGRFICRKPPPRPSESLTPRQIVAELDKYVVGQAQAKRAVAIALRNRMRRQKLPAELAEEIAPKNILMIGPTGVGKTEIARRLARLAQSPFIKVEASKFTEVGYVGRDVESMVRDLVELARRDGARGAARRSAREGARRPPRSASSICCCRRCRRPREYDDERGGDPRAGAADAREAARAAARRPARSQAASRSTSARRAFPSFEIIAGSSVEEVDINVKDMLPGLFQGRTKKRRCAVPEALEALAQEEEQKLIDMESVARAAVERVQQAGHHLRRRDRQGRRARRRPRPGRQPRRRAARHPADRRRARPSTRSTGWCGPITSCSSRPARSTSRSRRI